MQISTNTYTPNFKALMISPSGKRAIETRANSVAKEFLRDLPDIRRCDRYVDAVLTGRPDEYGDYNPLLTIIDKVTGVRYIGRFKTDVLKDILSLKELLAHEHERDELDKIAVMKDSAGKKRYFSFVNRDDAKKFIEYARGKDLNSAWYGVGLGLIEAMENYYRNLLEGNNERNDKYLKLFLQIQKVYKKPIEQAVVEIMTEKNLLGKGKEKDVYKIDSLPGYVLCVMRDKYNPEKPISPFYQCCPQLGTTEFDSPIIMNDDGMYIKKYTKGTSHSLPNRIVKNHGIEPLNHDDVVCFISQLETLSSFPIQSFINFAKKLQVLNKNRIRIDSNNPNNLLIDSGMKTINLIDLNSDDNKIPDGIIRPVNGLSDMESALCDSMMYLKLYDTASDDDKIRMDEYAKIIIKKCSIASKVANLGNFPNNTLVYFDSIDKELPVKTGKTRLQKYEDFRNHFKKIVSEEIISTQYKPTCH